MRKVRLFISFVLAFLIFLSAGCGRKGPLEKPVPRIPQAVKDFKAYQQGKKVYFSWTNPATDESGNQLEVVRTDLRVMELKDETLPEEKSLQEFLRFARPVEAVFPGRIISGPNGAVLNLDLERITGQEFLFGLRVKGKRGRWSNLSNLVKIKAVIVPEPPQDLKAEMSGQKVRLSWKSPEKMVDGQPAPQKLVYNVYRSDNGQFKKLNELPVQETLYEDGQVEAGKNYRYLVRALLPPYFDSESEDSQVVSLTATDNTPPATPEGLQAFSGPEGVALSWRPNPEEDLAGYRVYRAREGEKEVLLTPDLVKQASFVDSSVEKGGVYEYSITAVDKNHNESFPAKIKVKT